jgi:hypothetical protein
MATTTSPRFSPPLVKALDEAKIFGVRAGARSDHRFTGIWVVVVNGRVFARSWTVTPDGWYASFRRDGEGTIQVGERRVRVRAKHVRGERLLDAVEEAYARKYHTPASMTWVRGFRTKKRREATIEFLPAG